jgi:hypothetical protein
MEEHFDHEERILISFTFHSGQESAGTKLSTVDSNFSLTTRTDLQHGAERGGARVAGGEGGLAGACGPLRDNSKSFMSKPLPDASWSVLRHLTR